MTAYLTPPAPGYCEEPDPYEAGYDACYDGKRSSDNPHAEGTVGYDMWRCGFSDAGDNRCYEESDHRDDDHGGWTREDEESMTRGRDLLLRNEAGGYCF